MTLEYLREYRTYFHIVQNYGISESNAYKICKWVEDTLVKDKRFALPGHKALLGSDAEYEVILIDASESPIERPKKTETLLLRQKEAPYSQNTARRSQALPRPKIARRLRFRSYAPTSVMAEDTTSAYSKNPT